MINYARHDEEFYAVIKLSNGEEVLGQAVLTEDEGETLVFISQPVQIQTITKELPDGKIVKGMGFAEWMQLSDEDFFILREKDVIAIAAMSKEVRYMYESYLDDDEDIGDSVKQKKLKDSKLHVNPDTKMGYLGKIDEARKLFEKIYKS
tara:strand:- start:3438 stop:3884 length:447 start_codon:yes stop_codon:yes gene_type:complete